MKVTIHAVGRMKSGPEAELSARYLERFAKAAPALGMGFSGVTEIPESRAATPALRKREEAARLEQALAAGARLVILDERGKSMTSQAFATQIAGWRDEGVRDLVIAIGGPDGHDEAVLGRAALVLGLGTLTWPHQIARILIAEQLYRASTIISGHPYHRA